jgi:hypothetical protein
MRPSLTTTASRRTACATVTLALLAAAPAAPAAASEAGNLFSTPSQASTSAAKPAHGASNVLGAKASTSAATPATGAAKVPSQVTSTPTTTATTASSTRESVSGTSTTMLVAIAAGVLLLGGISFMILRDARSVAPVVEGAAAGGTRNPEGRLRKRRAQAKAARLQRKRHRKR